MNKQILLFAIIISMLTNCNSQGMKNQNFETATLGAGCFWCVEAIFENLNGVLKIESGYTGGEKPNPTYKEICSGLSGHAEVVKLTYDVNVITYKEILDVFFQTHDPTTLNKQGNDVGTQYRSVIYFHSDTQKIEAEEFKNNLNSTGAFINPVITEISPAEEFFVAEDYHQNYYNEHASQPYCSIMIKPKIDKFKKLFKDKLK